MKVQILTAVIGIAPLISGCGSSKPPAKKEEPAKLSAPASKEAKKLPSTVDDAATRVIAEWLNGEEKEKFAAMKKEEIYLLHHGLGRRIRNEFGLWADNKALLDDSGAFEPDGASMKIIEAIWEKLRRK